MNEEYYKKGLTSSEVNERIEKNLVNYDDVPPTKTIPRILRDNFFTYFNQFMWPYIVLSDKSLKTIPIGLNTLAGEFGINFGLQTAGYTLVAVPLVILFLATSKIYVGGITSGAVKG